MWFLLTNSHRITEHHSREKPKPRKLFLPKEPIRFATKRQKELIFQRDGGQCQYCGEIVSKGNFNAEHVIPWPEGATHIENLVVSCRKCNFLKRAQFIPIQFRPKPGVTYLSYKEHVREIAKTLNLKVWN